MAIEQIYPYIAVAYGTFGLAFGLFLWTKTRGYIFGTKAAIEKQVANAVTDIGAKVDEKLDALSETEIDLDPVTASINARVDALQEELPDLIATHLDMHFKAMQAAEAKNMGKLLEDLNLEGVSKEMQEAAIQKLSLSQRATMKLMTLKIPKASREAHPLGAALFDNSRAEIAQMIAQLLGQGEDGVTVESAPPSTGFGVR